MRGVILAVPVPKSASKRRSGSTPAQKTKSLHPKMGGPHKRHGTRKFVLAALEPTASGTGLTTATILQQVRKFSGKRIPEETVRQSLRTLVRQRAVRARRAGREKTYKLVQGAETSAVPRPSPIRPETLPGGPAALAATSAAERAVGSFPHKLAVGEVLILEVGERHVETASNIHGKVVLERHPRPRA